MRVLYTGFKGKNNSSYRLMQSIQGNKLLLTNSFGGLKRDIEKIELSFDLAIMFGLDKTLKNRVRIERTAEYEGVCLQTNLDVECIKDMFSECGIACDTAVTPTKYLCNAAYWHMLRKNNGNALFIHIPTIKNMDGEMWSKLNNCIKEFENRTFGAAGMDVRRLFEK